jgi:hypothetical protein
VGVEIRDAKGIDKDCEGGVGIVGCEVLVDRFVSGVVDYLVQRKR